MTRLINIDNGGTLTDFCLVDGGEVRYTKTLTTPYDLSRCLFDGLTKVSELAYAEPRLAALLQSTDCIRYSTTQGTNALVQRAGPQLGLLVTDPTLVEGLAATQAQEDLLAALVGFVPAIALFVAIKAINTLTRRAAKEPPVPAPPTQEVVLLTEIRDQLARRGA